MLSMSTSGLTVDPPSYTVLVVDDSPLELSIVSEMFVQRGHRVLCANNGAEALLLLASDDPDAVVSDGLMPILDGYQLCRLLKDDPTTRHLPVILLTGQARGLSHFWARTCGADRFLIKGRESLQVVDAVLGLIAPGARVPAGGAGPGFDRQDLGLEAIQQRLGKALENRLLETAMRDSIGHLFTLYHDSAEITGKALELLHELVLPGGIYLLRQGEGGPRGFGLCGPAVGLETQIALEDAAQMALGQASSGPVHWRYMPALKEGSGEDQDMALFCLPLGLPGAPACAYLALYLERQAFQDYLRLFEVACQELGRILDLAESRRRLQQAEEGLRQAEKIESLAQMSQGVAHHLNNLFQGIRIALDMALLKGVDESGRTAFLAQAVMSVEKGAGLARQILNFGGNIWCVKVPLDLNGLVREVVTAHPEWEVMLQLADDLPPVDGDAKQLKQALVHLLSNAAEAAGSASPIGLSTWIGDSGFPELREGRWITETAMGPGVGLSVSDSGCGASEEVLDRMFDPFFTTKQFGRGLGLPATLGILKAHGAGLQVERRPGQGLAFNLWFATPDAAPAPVWP